jgi:hypothetical protein
MRLWTIGKSITAAAQHNYFMNYLCDCITVHQVSPFVSLTYGAQCKRGRGNGFPVVFPAEGPMRFAGHPSRSNMFTMVWAADNRNQLFLVLEGYLTKFALRVSWTSFGNTTVFKTC